MDLEIDSPEIKAAGGNGSRGGIDDLDLRLSSSSDEDEKALRLRRPSSQLFELDLEANSESDDEEEDGPIMRYIKCGDDLPDVITGWTPREIWLSIWRVLISSPLNILLFLIPFSFMSWLFSWGQTSNFIFALLSMVPLAWLLGNATEELAARTNDAIGGFLNATFGNAVELIVAILALRRGLLRVVQASLLGSILSNMLLVLGTAFLLGGIKYKEQSYNNKGASTISSMLMLAMLALAMPAAFLGTMEATDATNEDILNISRVTSLILFIMYLMFLVFQLKTHSYMFLPEEGEEEEEPEMTVYGALILLFITTVIVSVEAELVVDAIEPVAKSWGLTDTFISIILLPVAGNAAEHVTAIKVAVNNKMDLTLGVVVGSSTQIAVFAVPLLVLVGWVVGQPLTLDFSIFQTTVVTLSTIIVSIVISNGRSNWLEGALLLAAYAVVGVAMYWHP